MGNRKGLVLSLLAIGVLAACSQKQPDASSANAPVSANPEADGSASTAPAAPLADVSESDARHIVGISYPPTVNRYPVLAKALTDYADHARADLGQALKSLGDSKPRAPYELSLAFEIVAETPDVVAVAADGGRYTGGAHSDPLVARFTWLPKRNVMLTAKDMLASPQALQVVSNYVREQLHTKLSVSADDAGSSPEERAEYLQSGTKMIDDGTAPTIDNFSQFQPVTGADGRIAAIRFVFPPYQVGPYSDGTQTVDVPAKVLGPYIAAEYADLFSK